MSLKTKILNKLYCKYLTQYKSISFASFVVIDYRCEIDTKTNLKIGKKSKLYKNTTIYKAKESELVIGHDSHIAPFGYILMGEYNLIIGDNVAIAKNCSFFCITNSIPTDSSILFKDSYDVGDITVGNNVFIGSNCVILPKTTIGENIVIAANSTVKGVLESGYLYGGNPAIKIRKLFEK
ncbi:MAG TPA: acyltransferase [Bacteroidetes bacterium]|nr:acyltransferase [Bacteroidota bacterium]